jgi:transcriptional regulator
LVWRLVDGLGIVHRPILSQILAGSKEMTMYLRPAFAVDDLERIEALIRANPFGLLVTTQGGVAEASHIPFTVERTGETLTLYGHFARPNPQCAAIAGGNALAIFSGPHAYIAPGWYAAQPSVPTWDFCAAHLSGVLEPVADDPGIDAMLLEMASADPAGFDLMALPGKYKAQMYAGIRAFRLVASKIEAQWKMSQNRSVEDRVRVIAALRGLGNDAAAELIAETLPVG